MYMTSGGGSSTYTPLNPPRDFSSAFRTRFNPVGFLGRLIARSLVSAPTLVLWFRMRQPGGRLAENIRGKVRQARVNQGLIRFEGTEQVKCHRVSRS